MVCLLKYCAKIIKKILCLNVFLKKNNNKQNKILITSLNFEKK